MTRPLSEWERYQRRLERSERIAAIVGAAAMLASGVLVVLVLWLAIIGMVAVFGGMS